MMVTMYWIMRWSMIDYERLETKAQSDPTREPDQDPKVNGSAPMSSNIVIGQPSVKNNYFIRELKKLNHGVL